jgi:hypothetical protein
VSLAEVERFSKDLKANRGLLAEGATYRLEAAVEIAAHCGYGFTLDEARAFIRSKTRIPGKELSDAELDRVTGGFVLRGKS